MGCASRAGAEGGAGPSGRGRRSAAWRLLLAAPLPTLSLRLSLRCLGRAAEAAGPLWGRLRPSGSHSSLEPDFPSVFPSGSPDGSADVSHTSSTPRHGPRVSREPQSRPLCPLGSDGAAETSTQSSGLPSRDKTWPSPCVDARARVCARPLTRTPLGALSSFVFRSPHGCLEAEKTDARPRALAPAQGNWVTHVCKDSIRDVRRARNSAAPTPSLKFAQRVLFCVRGRVPLEKHSPAFEDGGCYGVAKRCRLPRAGNRFRRLRASGARGSFWGKANQKGEEGKGKS